MEKKTVAKVVADFKNMLTGNVVVNYRDRPAGSESKLNTVSDGIKVIKMIMRMFGTYKPFVTFSAIAAALAVIGFAFLIPVLITFAQTGLVPKFPTLVVCCFSPILALFSGIILQTLRRKEKQDFEMNFVRSFKEK